MARITAGSASVKGLDKLLNQFDKIAKTKIVEAGITEACLRVERDAKKNCVGLGGDGTLKASITHNVELHGDSVTGVVAAPLDYAVYVEFGTGLFAVHGDGRKEVPWRYKDLDTGEWHTTSGMKPHPYLMPALDANREKIPAIIKSKANAYIRGAL